MQSLAAPTIVGILLICCPLSKGGEPTLGERLEVDATKVTEIWLIPPEQSGWIIRFRPDGSAHAQYGSILGDAAKLPKGSVDFGSLLKAVCRLKCDKRL